MPDELVQAPARRPAPRLGLKTELIHALADQGFPHRSIAQAVGISKSAVTRRAKGKLDHSAQAEKIKQGLRDRWALLASNALSGVNPEKIAESSAKDLAYIAAKATEMCGLAPPSVHEHYELSIQKYQVVAPQPVVPSVVEKSETQGKQ